MNADEIIVSAEQACFGGNANERAFALLDLLALVKRYRNWELNDLAESWERDAAEFQAAHHRREAVARAIAKAVYVSDDAVEDLSRGTKGYLFWLPAADAAIKAMEDLP